VSEEAYGIMLTRDRAANSALPQGSTKGTVHLSSEVLLTEALGRTGARTCQGSSEGKRQGEVKADGKEGYARGERKVDSS